jgi:hypothetical protein
MAALVTEITAISLTYLRDDVTKDCSYRARRQFRLCLARNTLYIIASPGTASTDGAEPEGSRECGQEQGMLFTGELRKATLEDNQIIMTRALGPLMCGELRSVTQAAVSRLLQPQRISDISRN